MARYGHQQGSLICVLFFLLGCERTSLVGIAAIQKWELCMVVTLIFWVVLFPYDNLPRGIKFGSDIRICRNVLLFNVYSGNCSLICSWCYPPCGCCRRAYFSDSSGTSSAFLCFLGQLACWQRLFGIIGHCEMRSLSLLSSEKAVPRCLLPTGREGKQRIEIICEQNCSKLRMLKHRSVRKAPFPWMTDCSSARVHARACLITVALCAFQHP